MVQYVNKPKTCGSFSSPKPQSPDRPEANRDGVTSERDTMAASLMNRAVSRTETLGAFRLSLNLLRNFSSAAAAAATENPSSDPIKAKRRKSKKNLIEVAQFLPNWGIGYHMAKAHWTGVSYEITKINLYKDGRHGKAWGIVHKDGLRAAEAPKKISGVHKRCWKYIPNLSKTTPATATAAQVQAA